jgi:8-oxo-dGTP diphosphatase
MLPKIGDYWHAWGRESLYYEIMRIDDTGEEPMVYYTLRHSEGGPSGPSYDVELNMERSKFVYKYSLLARPMPGKRLPLAPVERKVCTGVGLAVVDLTGRILLGKRKATHGAGAWALIGGWMRHGETFLDTAKREAMEEAGLEIHRARVVSSVTTIFPDDDIQSVTIFIVSDYGDWSGTPENREPHKLDGDWKWVNPHLPPEPRFKPIADLDLAKLVYRR